MAMTWRPPPDLALRLRVVAALTGKSANAIVTEATTEWLDHNQPTGTAELLKTKEPDDE